MTSPKLQQANGNGIHEHVGGSAGPAGENSSECACGVVFDGCQSHAEAVALMKQHVAANNKPNWLTLAGDFEEISNRFAELDGSDLPVPTYIRVNIQPGERGNDTSVKAVTDAIGETLFDRTGKVSEMSSGAFHYEVEGRVGAVGVHAFNSISAEWAAANDPKAALKVEIAKREAELAELKKKLATDEPATT